LNLANEPDPFSAFTAPNSLLRAIVVALSQCCVEVLGRSFVTLLSCKLFENVNSLFANESDGYKTTSAPSAFRFSCGRSARTRQESTPEQSECHIETAIKKIYLTDVAAVIEEVQLQCFKAKDQETSSAADPATVFDRVNRFPSHPQIISDRLSPFANNMLPFALNLCGAAHIRK
jgi:hypothetical protein